jgi:hypothetical protein
MYYITIILHVKYLILYKYYMNVLGEEVDNMHPRPPQDNETLVSCYNLLVLYLLVL